MGAYFLTTVLDVYLNLICRGNLIPNKSTGNRTKNNKNITDEFEFYEDNNLADHKGNRAKTHDEFVEEMARSQPSVEVVGKYVNVRTKVRCRCKNCGFEWESIHRTIVNGKGCIKCSRRYRKTTEDFIHELHQVNPNIEIVGKYNGANAHIQCRCKKCGNKWSATPNKLLHGRSCPKCSKKKGWRHT